MAPVALTDVDPALVAALQHLMDEYGPLGVANVVALMRGEPYGPPVTFRTRLERAAERAYTSTRPEPVEGTHGDHSAVRVIHDGPPHWDNYSG